MSDPLHMTRRTLRLTGFVGALAVLFVAGAAPGLATAPDGRSTRLQAHAIAVASGGDYSQAGFNGAFIDMDPSMLAYARQFAPLSDPFSGDGAARAGREAALTAAPDFSARALQALSWDAARLVNDSIPISGERNAAAAPFRLQANAEDRARAVECLAQAIYYEAAYEPAEGQAAVAQVVLNRVRHPVYPKTVCGVVYEGWERVTGCQFTFTCDGALGRAPVEPLWSRARQVAERALSGHVVKAVGTATHYHADYVVPYWLPSLAKLNKIGSHIFYRWSGDFGLPPAFAGRYAGNEPAVTRQEIAEQADAEAAAQVVARLGPVTETPTIAIAAAAAPLDIRSDAVSVTPELALETPMVKLPPPRAAPFAFRPNCVNSTLGNCSNF